MNLKDYMKSTGIPAATIARKAKVSHQTIKNVTRGRDIKISTMMKIEKAIKEIEVASRGVKCVESLLLQRVPGAAE